MTTERVLGITTRIGCRVACSYCPQDKFTRAYRQQSVEPGARLMLPELFEKYLATVPTSVKISFAGHAEPFLIDRCIELVEHAVSKGHSVGINTTLHGMTLDDVERLAEVSFVNFIIHLPGFIGDEPNEKMIVDETYLAVLDRLLKRNIPIILRVHGESTHPDAERVIRANGG
ncbi:MAG: radical SAM protein, partial [Lentisphaerae bacterium]|nr:radical SAM protein [Lentisphaerota bacterium]